MLKQKIIITGSAGYVGSNLEKFFKHKGYKVFSFDIINKTKKDYFKIDITHNEKLNKAISKIKPDIIIHTAGLSSLAQCEKNKTLAKKINVESTKNIINSIKNNNLKTKLIFLSSDYVFDGLKGNYNESSPKRPKTFYGQNKNESEEDIIKNLTNYIICRSANIYGRGGGNFFNFIIENLKQNKSIEVFDDVLYTPTYIDYFMDSLCQLVEKGYNGIIHITGNNIVSRYQFALEMARAFGKNTNLVKLIKQGNGLIAKNSSLDSSKLRKLLNNFCPSLKKTIQYCFNNLISPYFYFQDSRGKILGILQQGQWEEINYVESKKGFVRGNHYHKNTVEGFYVIEGKIDISLKGVINNLQKRFIAEKGDIFIINPNIIHVFKILKDSRWINMLSRASGKYNKDIIRANI